MTDHAPVCDQGRVLPIVALLLHYTCCSGEMLLAWPKHVLGLGVHPLGETWQIGNGMQ